MSDKMFWNVYIIINMICKIKLPDQKIKFDKICSFNFVPKYVPTTILVKSQKQVGNSNLNPLKASIITPKTGPRKNGRGKLIFDANKAEAVLTDTRIKIFFNILVGLIFTYDIPIQPHA